MHIAERTRLAIDNRRCFACQHYREPGMFSSRCLIGGLDPEATARPGTSGDKIIRATVRWDNQCPRFQLADAPAVEVMGLAA